MNIVQLVIKTTTGNTVVRQPISWVWPGNPCMYQVKLPHTHCNRMAHIFNSGHIICLSGRFSLGLKLMKVESNSYF